MKKIISMVLAGLMLCMSLSAFALTPEDFEAAMSEQFTSARMAMTMKAEITEMDAELLKELVGVDLTVLPSATLGYEMVMVTDQDMKKIQAKVDMTLETVPEVPFLDKNIATVYVDYDMTNVESPKYRTIAKLPDSEKYQVMDLTQLPEIDELMVQLEKMADLMTPEKTVELNEKISAYLPEIEKEYTENSEIISLNDAQIKEVINGLVPAMKEVILPLMGTMLDTEPELGLDEETEQYISNVFAAIQEVQLFAEDGVVVTTTLDPETKQLQSMDCVIKVDTNLNELVSKIGKALGSTDEDLAWLQEELPADKADFKGQLSMNITYSNLNDENLTVEFPVLTPQNSEDMIIGMTCDRTAVNVYYNGTKVDFKDVQPVIENDRTLVPIRHFCNALGISDDDIQYDDGIVTIQNGDTKITLTIDEQEVDIETNGETKHVTLDVPATEREGRTLVPLRFISENFGCDVSYEEFVDELGNVTGCLITVTPSAA